jgi:hypothetical protein
MVANLIMISSLARKIGISASENESGDFCCLH